MRRDLDDLLLDLADESRDARRQATLEAGASVLRRRRVRTIAVRGAGALLGVAAVATGVLHILSPHKTVVSETTVAAVPAPPTGQPKALTDAELLGLFPDTPVALAQMDNGKKRLIFPRPGDEQRFVTKL